jgi:uncharacterized protein (DUF934 family)
MPLVKNGKAIADPFTRLADEEPVPSCDPIIVSLERWQAERERLIGRNAPVGLRLRSDQSPTQVVEDLAHFALIELAFPKFTDGRAYSYARLLRERYGYAGELRAVGNVLRDQLWFMDRCGFDSFEIPRVDAAEIWHHALDSFSVRYQPSNDGRPWASHLRRRHLAAE